MKLEELERMAAEDFVFNDDDIININAKISDLHIKYAGLRSRLGLQAMKQEQAVATIRLTKREYYLGKADPEVYRAKPQHKVILRQDVEAHLAADPEVQEAETQLGFTQAKISFIDRQLKSLDHRNYQVKNHLDALKYFNGGNRIA